MVALCVLHRRPDCTVHSVRRLLRVSVANIILFCAPCMHERLSRLQDTHRMCPSNRVACRSTQLICSLTYWRYGTDPREKLGDKERAFFNCCHHETYPHHISDRNDFIGIRTCIPFPPHLLGKLTRPLWCRCRAWWWRSPVPSSKKILMIRRNLYRARHE